MPLSKAATLASKRIRYRKLLEPAWRHVRKSCLRSPSFDIREEARRFEENELRNIERIQSQLRNHTFTFKPARGIPAKKSKGGKRPIVVAPIESRIVQRAILTVLQSTPSLKDYIDKPTSYGGLKGKTVSEAIRKIHDEIIGGAQYYIRTDIQDFFSNLPTYLARQVIQQEFKDDSDFVALFHDAIKVDLVNYEDLKGDIDIFPLGDDGVAQGCCLSPLVGNLVLSEFDTAVNSRNVTCLRYVDDLILIGPTESAVKRTFNWAKKELSNLGLTLYDPFQGDTSGKADAGHTNTTINFLGCDISRNFIRPERKARDKLLSKVEHRLSESMVAFKDPKNIKAKRLDLTNTLKSVDNLLMGWGNQYSFCNYSHIQKHLDKKVNEKIRTYLTKYSRVRGALKRRREEQGLRRVVGVHLLTDSKNEPIVIKEAKGRGNSST